MTVPAGGPGSGWQWRATIRLSRTDSRRHASGGGLRCDSLFSQCSNAARRTVTLPAVVILLGAAIWLRRALLEYPLGRGRMGSRNWLPASCAIIACGCNLAVLSAVGLTPLAIGLRLISLIFPFATGTAFLWHTSAHMVRTSGPVGRRIVIATSDPSCGLIDRVRICPGNRPEIVGIFLLGRTAHVHSSVVSYLEAEKRGYADHCNFSPVPVRGEPTSPQRRQSLQLTSSWRVTADWAWTLESLYRVVCWLADAQVEEAPLDRSRSAGQAERGSSGGIAGIDLVSTRHFGGCYCHLHRDARSDALFCQRRHGLNGKEFNLLKFRTMHCHSADHSAARRDEEG